MPGYLRYDLDIGQDLEFEKFIGIMQIIKCYILRHSSKIYWYSVNNRILYLMYFLNLTCNLRLTGKNKEII